MEAKILQLAAKLGSYRNHYEALRISLQESYDLKRHQYLQDPSEILRQLTELNEVISESHDDFNLLIREYAKMVTNELDAIDAQEKLNDSRRDTVEPITNIQQLVPSLV